LVNIVENQLTIVTIAKYLSTAVSNWEEQDKYNVLFLFSTLSPMSFPRKRESSNARLRVNDSRRYSLRHRRFFARCREQLDSRLRGNDKLGWHVMKVRDN
jgi:hypothetical protein